MNKGSLLLTVLALIILILAIVLASRGPDSIPGSVPTQSQAEVAEGTTLERLSGTPVTTVPTVWRFENLGNGEVCYIVVGTGVFCWEGGGQ